MAELVLVKAWTLSANYRHKLPEEEDHEEVDRDEAAVPLEPYPHRMCPQHSIVLLDSFEQLIGQYESSDEVEYTGLEISLKDEKEVITADPLVHDLHVLQWATEDEIVGIAEYDDADAVYLYHIKDFEL